MQYDFNLLANGGQTIEVVGRFVTYKEGLGKIRVKLSKGGFVDLVPGQGVEDVEFTQITINDLSGNANKGSVLAGAFKFRDATIAGAVNVIDGGKIKTLSNTAFVFSVSNTSDATTAPAVYLVNPASSVKNIVIKSFCVSFSSLQDYGVVATPAYTGADISAIGLISKSQAGLSVAKAYSHTSGAQSGPLVNSYVSARLGASVADRVLLQEPLVLVPGKQIKVFGTAVSSSMICIIEYVEEYA